LARRKYTDEEDAALLRCTAGEITILAEQWGRSRTSLLNRRNFLRAYQNKRPQPRQKTMPAPMRLSRPAWFDENFDSKMRGSK